MVATDLALREAAASIDEAEGLADRLETAVADGYLEFRRGRELYGGWRRDDNAWVDRPALKAAAVHLAARALYCPVCLEEHSQMRLIGYTGTSEYEEFDCEFEHGPFTCRSAYVPRTIAIEGGRQSGKTSTMLPEFCSWQLGYRPWDGTLTCPRVEEGDWIIASPSLKTSEGAALGARYERMMRRHIVRKLKNDSGWQLDSECGFAKVHKFSYSQWENYKNSDSNPWYDLIIVGCLWDESMPAGARRATLRGLLKNRAIWGRELIGASFTNSTYLRNEIRNKAFNRQDASGNWGQSPQIICMQLSTEDNPALTKRGISEFAGEVPIEQRKAWLDGSHAGDGYLALPQFDKEQHSYMPPDGDITGKHLPEEWPVILSIDPHDSKPWAIQMMAITPDHGLQVFREWPEGNILRMKSSAYSLDDYVALIELMTEELPGGKDRVIRRLIDPRYSSGAHFSMGAKNLRDLLRQKGLVFDGSFSASVPLRLERTRDLLKQDKVRVSQVCRNTMFSFENLHYRVDADGVIKRNKDGEGSIDDEGKDHWDPFGFAAVVGLRYRPWRVTS